MEKETYDNDSPTNDKYRQPNGDITTKNGQIIIKGNLDGIKAYFDAEPTINKIRQPNGNITTKEGIVIIQGDAKSIEIYNNDSPRSDKIRKSNGEVATSSGEVVLQGSQLSKELYENAEPIPNKVRQPNGDITTEEGTIIIHGDIKSIEMYNNASPRPNKIKKPDGTITPEEGENPKDPEVEIEEFKFTVNPGEDNNYILPTSGVSNTNSNIVYDWIIEWGDGTTENATGISSAGGGIEHIYPNSETYYQIEITPHGEADYGWLRAFGNRYNITTGSGVQTNKNKIISLDNPITEKMFCISEHTAGNYYLDSTFQNLKNPRFTMGEKFNIPQTVINYGNYCYRSMFQGCSGAEFNMNNIFQIPDAITLGTYFMYSMFMGCIGTNFKLNILFSFPQNFIRNNQTHMLGYCFANCNTNNGFQLNDIIKLPLLTQEELDITQVFYYTFNIAGGILINRTIESIINNNPTPVASGKKTFAGGNTVWSDWAATNTNWR